MFKEKMSWHFNFTRYNCKMTPRIIDIPFKKKSVFLFGPRQVGKSTLVKHMLADMDFLKVDLLKGGYPFKVQEKPELPDGGNRVLDKE